MRSFNTSPNNLSSWRVTGSASRREILSLSGNVDLESLRASITFLLAVDSIVPKVSRILPSRVYYRGLAARQGWPSRVTGILHRLGDL